MNKNIINWMAINVPSDERTWFNYLLPIVEGFLGYKLTTNFKDIEHLKLIKYLSFNLCSDQSIAMTKKNSK